MNRFYIAALAATIALSTGAAATANPITFERDTAHIDYRDLDLASHDGRTQLVGRIRKAAERICADHDGGVPSFANFSQCYQVLVTSGIGQIDKIASAKRGYTSRDRAIAGNAMTQAPDAGRAAPPKSSQSGAAPLPDRR